MNLLEKLAEPIVRWYEARMKERRRIDGIRKRTASRAATLARMRAKQ
jgi:hypothetical protein